MLRRVVSAAVERAGPQYVRGWGALIHTAAPPQAFDALPCCMKRPPRTILGRFISPPASPPAVTREGLKIFEVPAAAAAAAAALLFYSSSQPSNVARCDTDAVDEDRRASSPFVYPELEAGIRRRVDSQRRLIAYMQEKSKEVQALQAKFMQLGGPGSQRAQQWMERQLQDLQEDVNHETQYILYGIRERGARDRYMARYGCAAWTDEAMETIRGFSPIIEIGAGKGQWQAELARRGADIIAYDNGEAVPCPEISPVGEVHAGDHTELRKHPGRTLLLVYPEGGMAIECLQCYCGDVLLYVGEGYGGVNASAAFFDELEREWECEAVVQLAPFRENFERLYVMRRKARSKRRWFGLG